MATYFIEPYTKYYNTLNSSGGMENKCKELEEYINQLANNISSLSSFVKSSTWKEIGSEEITNNSFPKTSKTLDALKVDISEHLKLAITNSVALLGKVKELKEKDEEYETKKQELESLKKNEPSYSDENGYESSSHSNWRNNVSNLEKEIKKLEEDCKKLQEESRSLANGINAIELEKIVEDVPVATTASEQQISFVDTTNTGNTRLWTYNGITYITPNSKMGVGDYVSLEKKKGIYETTNYSKYGDHCLGFAYVHAYDIYAGITNDTADSGYHYRHASSFEEYSSDNKNNVLKVVYDEINSGKPVVLQVNGNKKGTSRHYVTVLGYNSNVKNASQLTEDDLVILDSYDGNVKTVGKNGRRFMVTGAACHKKYSGYQLYKIKKA